MDDEDGAGDDKRDAIRGPGDSPKLGPRRERSRHPERGTDDEPWRSDSAHGFVSHMMRQSLTPAHDNAAIDAQPAFTLGADKRPVCGQRCPPSVHA